MVFVAEWLRYKTVTLVYAGSNPVEHPKFRGDKCPKDQEDLQIQTGIRSAVSITNIILNVVRAMQEVGSLEPRRKGQVDYGDSHLGCGVR
jgi:hypothetical protein